MILPLTLVMLEEPFKSAWANTDVFAQVRTHAANSSKENIFRQKEGRITLRTTVAGESFFLKYHQGIGWKEIFKNLFQFRTPVLGARNEYMAAMLLARVQVDTLTPVAFAARGLNPAAQESFLITRDLAGTISLEDYCRNWATQKPGLRIKNALINKVAESAKRMHGSGINHRDFYICHFLLDEQSLQRALATQTDKTRANDLQKDFRCYLIDLHRCLFNDAVPRRWLVKDLGGLLYSTMDLGLRPRDYYRFIKHYTGKPLAEALRDTLWREVLVNAQALYQKDFKKPAPQIFHPQR